MKPEAKPIMELTEAHADGTHYVDGEGDIWAAVPVPFGGLAWTVTRWLPFAISTQLGNPGVQYGPYTPVIGPDGERLLR